MARNVVALVDPPKRTREDDDEDPEPMHWTTGQVVEFLDYVDATTREGVVNERRTRKGKEHEYARNVAADPMLRAVSYLLVYTGMRRGEACGLLWKNVHLDRGVVSVRQAGVMVGGSAARSGTKSRRGRRRRRSTQRWSRCSGIGARPRLP